MKEEIQKLMDDLQKEAKKIKIELPSNTLSNIANKPYWDLERKYRKRMEKIKEKYKDNNQDTE